MSAEIMRSDAEWQFLLDTANRRIAELEADRDSARDYAIALQRLIERFCRGDMSTLERGDAPHHHDMLMAKAERIAELEKENARLQSVISVLQQEAEPGRYVGPYDAEFWGER